MAQHGETAGRDIRRRRIEQGTVIGERDIIQIIIVIIGIEGAPAAVGALQAFDPLARARDRTVVIWSLVIGSLACRAVHRHRDNSGIVEIWIIGVGILKCPAARPHMRLMHRPIAGDVGNLQRLQPF